MSQAQEGLEKDHAGTSFYHAIDTRMEREIFSVSNCRYASKGPSD